MPDAQSAAPIDQAMLNAFIGQMLTDLGGASSVALVRMGDALGLYKTLHAAGPMTPTELAQATNVDQRYLASGCRIRLRPTTSPTTPDLASSLCLTRRRWCLRFPRALST